MTYRKLSLAQVLAMSPCNRDNRHLLFAGKKTLTLRQAIKAGASISDLLWVAGKLRLGKECAEFAKRCAERAQGYAASDASSYARDAASYASYAVSYASYAAIDASDAVSYALHAAIDANSYASETAAQYADMLELFSRKAPTL